MCVCVCACVQLRMAEDLRNQGIPVPLASESLTVQEALAEAQAYRSQVLPVTHDP